MGLLCNWWRQVGNITPHQIRGKLNAPNLNMHINHFTLNNFNTDSPFISMSAGTMERDAVAMTNYAHRARRTALWFGTNFGQSDSAYLYTCWLILGPRPAVEIEGVAEEVRDINSYRHYSAFQTEGEITAKVSVPDNQIKSCEKWSWNRATRALDLDWTVPNPRFTPPEQLSNVRELV
jgi:hypothetical protein